MKVGFIALAYRTILDPFDGAPPGLQVVLEVVFVLFGALCGWIAFDTRQALTKLLSLGPPSRLKINPNRKIWIWFYRIDGFVVFAGVVVTLVSHWFRH
jgi:hypothetical protein